MLVGSETVHDPLFTDDDADDLLAWMKQEADRCPGCGQPRHESFDPANQDAYKVHALRCFACEGRARKQAKATGDTEGIYYTVEKDG